VVITSKLAIIMARLTVIYSLVFAIYFLKACDQNFLVFQYIANTPSSNHTNTITFELLKKIAIKYNCNIFDPNSDFHCRQFIYKILCVK